jgi:hypothetical protein
VLLKYLDTVFGAVLVAREDRGVAVRAHVVDVEQLPPRRGSRFHATLRAHGYADSTLAGIVLSRRRVSLWRSATCPFFANVIAEFARSEWTEVMKAKPRRSPG